MCHFFFDVQSNQLRTTALVEYICHCLTIRRFFFISSINWWFIFLSSAVISASIEKWKRAYFPVFIFCLSLSWTHEPRSWESNWKAGRWPLKKLPILFCFPFLNWSSWPFHGLALTSLVLPNDLSWFSMWLWEGNRAQNVLELTVHWKVNYIMLHS